MTTIFSPFHVIMELCSNKIIIMIFFEIGQQKINFSFYELGLPNDAPVYTLKKVMEELDFSFS